MIRTLLAPILLLTFTTIHAQDIEIGKASGSTYEITADREVLIKSLQRTMGDGSQVTSLHIESTGAFHYIVGEGTYKGYFRMIAAALRYDAATRAFYLTEGGHVMCSSAACSGCEPFREKGRIIGCKCADKGTVSNQCNFTSSEKSTFQSNFKRAMDMKK